MELVASLGNDKENWGQISALMNRLESTKIVLVKDKKTEDFPEDDRVKIISIDNSQPLVSLVEELKEKLKAEVSGDFEVAVSLASGTGKEHMALIAALLGVPVGVKLVVFTKEGVKFIS